ncbi:NAD-dependent succinate-semialdehyde dehydrogenase [Nocardioides sp. NBC_00850]|uniref:NAD-dependent succinate-semialdehyde dehydrogenase n=1 Tax=Nocardioides sp. NBC_00850 TaxID=2976001 RepID=UPI00386D799C|nr:NAD-dependent succinate-semialdehyde dehydrogenase [Nocardioides sp. NBC_00850]
MTLTARLTTSAVPTDLYIAGRWTSAKSARRFSVRDPATELEIAQVADSDAVDAGLAMAAAAEAQESWGATPSRTRADILRNAFDLVVERRDEFARLITAEMGKPLREAQVEVDYGAEFLRWFADRATAGSGRYAASPDGKLRIMVTKKPVGPCLLITPWNFPLAMATRKIGPALAAGCTVVVKPAQLTPLTTLLLTSVFDEVGLPAGVLNVVPTTNASEVVNPLLRDPRLRKVSFTGSTAVGQNLLRTSADRVLRTSMELGGNAPFIVFDDADIDQAVDGAVAAKLRNMGEACTAANRFLVQNGIHDEFARRLADRFGKLRLGAGAEPGTDIGPMISERSRQEIHSSVRNAIDSGASTLVGGEIPAGRGYFYPPTVLAGVSADARVAREEVFGPVAPLIRFDSEDEAVALANDTEYGLASYLFTRDLSRAHRLPDRLEFGMVGLNTGIISNPAAPFGGVKQSGLGREGGDCGLEEYQETQYIGTPTSGPNA